MSYEHDNPRAQVRATAEDVNDNKLVRFLAILNALGVPLNQARIATQGNQQRLVYRNSQDLPRIETEIQTMLKQKTVAFLQAPVTPQTQKFLADLKVARDYNVQTVKQRMRSTKANIDAGRQTDAGHAKVIALIQKTKRILMGCIGQIQRYISKKTGAQSMDTGSTRGAKSMSVDTVPGGGPSGLKRQGSITSKPTGANRRQRAQH